MNYLSEYSTFENKEQLNKAVYEHICNNAYELNETERTTLKLISRYCVKFAGACHLKAATIADLIERSEKTARRALTKLADLGIIEKVATTRKVKGGKGANIIRILSPKNINDQSSVSSRPSAEELTESSVEPQKIENEPPLLLNQKSTLQETYIPSNALRKSLPTKIYDAMSRYWNAEEIYKYYGILLRAKKSTNPNVVIEDNPEPFLDALENVRLKLKLGKINKLENYLYAAWQDATGYAARLQAKAKKTAKFSEWLDF